MVRFSVFLRHSTLSRIILLGFTLFTISCGKISSEIEADFNSNVTPPAIPIPKNSLIGGFAPSALTQRKGTFTLSASVGNQESIVVQSSGSYQLYGGVQGEVFSR